MSTSVTPPSAISLLHHSDFLQCASSKSTSSRSSSLVLWRGMAEPASPIKSNRRVRMAASQGDDVTVVDDAAQQTASKGTKRNSTRVIRTFEEVQVLKHIVGEEWYEELECGICSGILGATQVLVPCGHSFCGPCAWQWIIVNKNITCPHCRAQVIPETPLVPNIIVDQIVDRKLKGLPDGVQKTDLLAESKAKAEAWGVLQAGMMRSKPKRRTKGFEEWFGLFDSAPAPPSATEPSSQGHRRRASRHIELGSPIGGERQLLAEGGMTLSAIRRMEAEQAAIFRRVGMNMGMETTTSPEDIAPRTVLDRQVQTAHRVQLVNSPTPSPPVQSPTRRPQYQRANTTPHGRPTPLRSQALVARQSRYRAGGTRDDALVVSSDSESD